MSYKVQINPDVLEMLRSSNCKNIDELVNAVMTVYLNNGFIKTNQIVGHFNVDKVYRKEAPEIADVFDETVHDYVGVEVTGEVDSRSIWIPNIDLHDALVENTDIIVLRSPRKGGIRRAEADYCMNPIPPKDDMM